MFHTEATLTGLNKPDLIKLVLQLESEMNSDIKELTLEIRELVAQMKKVEADVAIVKNVNEKLINQLIETERHCWANAQSFISLFGLLVVILCVYVIVL